MAPITTRAEYLYPPEEPPEHCPMCGDRDIGQDDCDYPDLHNQIQKYSCKKCLFKWTELFVFKNWEQAMRVP